MILPGTSTSDRSFRKKPAGSILSRGDSDSDSDSEEEKARERERERVRVNGGSGCSSHTASGATDGPISSRNEAEIAEALHCHNNTTAFLTINSAEFERDRDKDRDRGELDEREDGLGLRKKKTKPSARKAANLSGFFSF